MDLQEENGAIKVDIEKLNILDKETGVYNSDFFILRLNEEIKRATRYELFFSFIMIGLNNRKKLFETADEKTVKNILEEIGYTIKDNVRGDVDLVGHLERGLFSIIVPETDIHGSHNLAKRIIEKLQKSLKVITKKDRGETSEDISVRGGIIEVPEDSATSKMVIKRTKRAFMKGQTEYQDGIGLVKPLEKYPSKKKKSHSDRDEKDITDKKEDITDLPFIDILNNPETTETDKADETDIKILKELENKKILYSINQEGDIYIKKSLDAFGSVKLLNQKKIIFIEDPLLKTTVSCVTPQALPEIRENILKENTYCAGTIIYSYKELKMLNSAYNLTGYNTDNHLSEKDRKIINILEKFKGNQAIKGQWIVDPKSPFDPLYMMVRRRFLYKTEKSPGIYYHELLKEDNRSSLFPVYPNYRLSSFEALRLLKKAMAIEIITENEFNHVIHNLIEFDLFYQMEE